MKTVNFPGPARFLAETANGISVRIFPAAYRTIELGETGLRTSSGMLATLFAGIVGLVLISIGWITIEYRDLPPSIVGKLTIPIGLLMAMVSLLRVWKARGRPPAVQGTTPSSGLTAAGAHSKSGEGHHSAPDSPEHPSEYFHTSSDFYKILPETLINLPAYKFAQVARFQGQESLRTAVAKILWLSNNRPLSNEEWRQVVLYLSVLEGFIVRSRAENGDADNTERYRQLFKQSGFSGTLALSRGLGI
jgi:hypothetical protein